jgi:hypothetical protein
MRQSDWCFGDKRSHGVRKDMKGKHIHGQRKCHCLGSFKWPLNILERIG